MNQNVILFWIMDSGRTQMDPKFVMPTEASTAPAPHGRLFLLFHDQHVKGEMFCDHELKADILSVPSADSEVEFGEVVETIADNDPISMQFRMHAVAGCPAINDRSRPRTDGHLHRWMKSSFTWDRIGFVCRHSRAERQCLPISWRPHCERTREGGGCAVHCQWRSSHQSPHPSAPEKLEMPSWREALARAARTVKPDAVVWQAQGLKVVSFLDSVVWEVPWVKDPQEAGSFLMMCNSTRASFWCFLQFVVRSLGRKIGRLRGSSFAQRRKFSPFFVKPASGGAGFHTMNIHPSCARDDFLTKLWALLICSNHRCVSMLCCVSAVSREKNEKQNLDKNDPFLNMGFKHGKSGWTKMVQHAVWGSFEKICANVKTIAGSKHTTSSSMESHSFASCPQQTFLFSAPSCLGWLLLDILILQGFNVRTIWELLVSTTPSHLHTLVRVVSLFWFHHVRGIFQKAKNGWW